MNLIKSNCQSDAINKVFSIGIGNEVSRTLVRNMAKAGKGDYCFVKESDMDTLKAKVINQLQRAAEPALIDCEFRFMPWNKGPLNS